MCGRVADVDVIQRADVDADPDYAPIAWRYLERLRAWEPEPSPTPSGLRPAQPEQVARTLIAMTATRWARGCPSPEESEALLMLSLSVAN